MRVFTAILISMLLLPALGCGGEKKDQWTHGDSQNWLLTCDEIADSWNDDDCKEDEGSIIKALDSGWSKSCTLEYYKNLWNSDTPDPDPYRCEGGVEAQPKVKPKYKLAGTHYPEANLLFVFRDYGCLDVPSNNATYARNVHYKVEDSQGVLLGTLRFKTTEEGAHNNYPGACVYIYSAKDLPIRGEYTLKEMHKPLFATNAEELDTHTVSKKDFRTNYGITTISSRITT